MPPFGTTVDPIEAGRKGGQPSALARRMRPLSELERKVLEAKNGAAAVKLLEIRMRRDQALERERFRADDVLCDLLDQSDREREIIASLRAETERLRAARHALFERERNLAAAVSATEGDLVARLRDLADEDLDALLLATGRLEVIDDEAT